MSNLSLKLVSYLKTTSILAQKLEWNSPISSQFVKFLIVGLLNTLIGLSLMLFLKNGLNWSYSISTLSGNIIGASASFLLNRGFTFKSRVSFGQGGLRFAAVVIASYLFSYSASTFIAGFLQHLTVGGFQLSKENMAIFIGSGLYTIINYHGQKRLVFKEDSA